MTLCSLARVTHQLIIMINRTRKQIVPNDSLNNGKGRMTQTTMPPPSGWPTNMTSLLVALCSCLLRPQRVEAALTLAVMEYFLRGPILYEKIMGMKLNIGIIIRCEMVHKNKTFIGARDVEDIL